MTAKIEHAIKCLVENITSKTSADDALKFTQAILNLAQTQQHPLNDSSVDPLHQLANR